MSPLNRKRSLIGIALLCAGALAGLPAMADQADQSVKMVRVKYTSDDVTRPDAASRLYRRIQIAAKQVCDAPDLLRELRKMSDYQRCFDRAVDLAVAKVDAPALTAIHQSKVQHGTTG